MIVTARVAFLILQVVRAVDMIGIGVIDNDYNSVDYVYPKIDPAAYDIRTLQCRTSTYVKTYDSCFHGNGTRCGDAVFLPVYRDNMWECHCDYNCKLYGECCHDFERACADHDWQEEDKIQIAERIIPTDPRMEPTDNPIGGAWQRCQLAENTDYRGLWVTHGCPGDWTDGYVRRLCTDDLTPEERESLSNTNIALLDTPVVSTGSYKVYANVFCSVCHGENETDIFYFLTKWNCFRRNNLNDILDNDVDHVVGELSNFQDCTVTHDLPVYSSRVRSCTEYLSTCDPTLFSDDELFALWESFCQSNFSMCETGVTVPNTYFKNHYCGYCNGYQINFCGITGEGSGGNTIPTLTVIFEVRRDGRTMLSTDSHNSGREVFLQNNASCVGGAYVIGSECRGESNTPNFHQSELNMTDLPVHDSSVWVLTVVFGDESLENTPLQSDDELFQINRDIQNTIMQNLVDLIEFQNISNLEQLGGINRLNLVVKILWAESYFRVFSEACFKAVQELGLSFGVLEFHLMSAFHASKTNDNAQFCPDGAVTQVNLVGEVFTFVPEKAYVYFNMSGESFFLNTIRWTDAHQLLSGNSPRASNSTREIQMHYMLDICYPAKLLCPDGIMLVLDERQLIKSNRKHVIVFDYHNFRLEATEYVRLFSEFSGESLVYTCFENAVAIVGSVIDGTLSWISFACTVLSLLCLFASLMLHLTVSSFHNLHGFMMCCLCSSLFCAHLLLLTTLNLTHLSTVCRVMAACTHYFWLVSFSWMAVIAFDVCRVFARSIYIPSTRFDTALFAVYSLIGWGLPVVIVGVAVLVDNCNCTDFEVGYGEGEYCWIHDQTAFVTFFLTPVATAIVFNIVCFCIAFFSVHYNVMKNNRNLENKSFSTSKRQLIMSFRLASIMGVTWVFGLAQPFANNLVIDYIFTLLNASQGIFIFASFSRILFAEVSKSWRSDGKSSESSKSRRDKTTVATLTKSSVEADNSVSLDS